ncbi:MAG: hypothetical protein ABI366_09660 [Ginsengibacter sp.]
MNFSNSFILVAALFACSCNSQSSTSDKNKSGEKTSTIGKIEIYNINALQSIDSNATIEVISKGFNWAEGPLWIANKNLLLFSDVP